MSIRVLLADDHRLLRDALRALLANEHDVQVVGEASDGRAMLELARKLQPDLVVLDIAMPDLNGIEAAARLRTQDAGIKIVAISAYADKRFVLEMLNAGAKGYVVKAAAGTELVRALRAVAEGHDYLCAEVAGTVIERATGGSPGTAAARVHLGRREREVLQLLAEGETSPAIAVRMHISVATVEAHRRNIMRKLDLHSIAELTKYAIREGLTSL
jgi:two-component system NarL family response regulator